MFIASLKCILGAAVILIISAILVLAVLGVSVLLGGTEAKANREAPFVNNHGQAVHKDNALGAWMRENPDKKIVAVTHYGGIVYEEPKSEHQPKLKKRILSVVSDMMADLLYYDRKEDDALPVGAIEKAIKDGVITVDEIVDEVRRGLKI